MVWSGCAIWSCYRKARKLLEYDLAREDPADRDRRAQSTETRCVTNWFRRKQLSRSVETGFFNRKSKALLRTSGIALTVYPSLVEALRPVRGRGGYDSREQIAGGAHRVVQGPETADRNSSIGRLISCWRDNWAKLSTQKHLT